MTDHLNDRLARCYPDLTTVSASGLSIDGCSLRDIAADFGTPTYVLSERTLRNNARAYRFAFSRSQRDVTVTFASKSMPARPALQILADEGLWIDVASRGELFLALHSGADPERIIVHGNAKDDAQIADAVRAGVGLIVVDNEAELELIERHARGPQAILLRLNPGIDASTHPSVATGHSTSKFGMGPEALRRALRRARSSTALEVRGIHAHVGSQIRSLDEFARLVEAVAAMGEFEIYNIGGGLGVALTPDQPTPSVQDYANTVLEAAHAYLPRAARIFIEPGRSIVARAGITLYEVVSVKRGEVVHVAVNGGMSDNLGTTVHAERRIADIVARPDGADTVELVGWHCESGDVLASGVQLGNPQPGDLLALPMTGAYTYSLASNYNAALRAPLVVVNDGYAQLAIRRETLDDLVAREVG